MSGGEPLTCAFDGIASRVDASGFRSVGFTSAVLGEGVTTTTLGTALSLAALRAESVLLVDANWIHPSLTDDAAAGAAPGLADYLAKKADLAAIIRLASRSRLAFVPVGDRTCARPTLRTLSSFLASASASGRTVVVDLPPLLSGDSFVLPWAALLDQVFVVLREAATPLPVVQEALARLGPDTTPHIVLNRSAAPAADMAALLQAARA